MRVIRHSPPSELLTSDAVKTYNSFKNWLKTSLTQLFFIVLFNRDSWVQNRYFGIRNLCVV